MGQSASFNQVILIGRVGRDVEFERDKEGYNHRARISLATNEIFVFRDPEEKKEITQWHIVFANGKLAEVARDYVRTGQLLLVRGMIKYGKRDDVKYTAIKAEDLVILSKKQDPF